MAVDLQGLRDRPAALDGTLTIESRRGDGTRLRARLPCEKRERRDSNPRPPA